MRIFVFLLFSISLFSFQDKPAKSDVKYQLLVFEGSDWCSNCVYLSRQVLEQEEFSSFISKEQIELIRVDFPQRHALSHEKQARNAQLAEKYQFEGVFPTLVLVQTESNHSKKFQYKKENLNDFKTELLYLLKQLEE